MPSAERVDGLEIGIGFDPGDIEEGLRNLRRTLADLTKVTNQLTKSLEEVNFEKLETQLRLLASSLQPLEGFKTQAGSLISALRHFTKTADEINKYTNFDKFRSQMELLGESLSPLAGFRTKLGTTLSSLERIPEVSEKLDGADMTALGVQLLDLVEAIEPLSQIEGTKLRTVANHLDRFADVFPKVKEALGDESFGPRIDQLVKALAPLQEIQVGKLGVVTGQLKRFSEALPEILLGFQNMDKYDLKGKIQLLADGLQPLYDIQKSGIGPIFNQLRKLPEVMEALEQVDMRSFSQQIKELAEAMKPLAVEMEKISQGFAKLPARLQQVITAQAKLTESIEKTSKGYGIFGSRIRRILLDFGLTTFALTKAKRIFSYLIDQSSEYVENLHLYRLAMREASEEGLKFAFVVRDALGIDPSEWIRYQAVFQNMATGFGISAEKASIMSKALTQLGYDLSSVFNVDYETAMRKLESALAGQPRPMREWGFDISESTLKLVALRKNIQKNVEDMTQMEKAQLRFIHLMEVSRKQGYFGDMARTVMTPANAIRILNQELLQLYRALGEMFIPIVIQAIPYVIAFTKVLTDMAHVVAAMVGFEMPKIDYSSLESDSHTATEAVDEVTDSIKRLQRVTAGFDELNIIADNTKDIAALGEDTLNLDLGEHMYDFLENLDSRVDRILRGFNKQLTYIRENISEIMALGAYLTTGIWGTTRGGLGTGLSLMGGSITIHGAFQLGKGTEDTLLAAIRTNLGTLITTTAMTLTFGPKGLVWSVPLNIALILGAMKAGHQSKLKEKFEGTLLGLPNDLELDVLGEALEHQLAPLHEYFLNALKGSQDLEPVRRELRLTVNTLGELTAAYKSGVTSAQEYATEMHTILSDFHDDTKQLLLAIRDNLIEGLSGSFGVALIRAGESLSEAEKFLNEVTDRAIQTNKEQTERWIELSSKKSLGETLSESEEEEWQKLVSKFDTGAREVKTLLDDLTEASKRVKWGDPQSFHQFLTNMRASVEKTKLGIEEARDHIVGNIRQLQEATDDPAQIEKLRDYTRAVTEDAEKNLDTLRREASKVFNMLEKQMVEDIARVIASASGRGEIGPLLDMYARQILGPGIESLNEMMALFGEEGSTKALDAFTKIREALMENMYTIDEPFIEAITPILEDMGINVEKFATTLKEEISGVFLEPATMADMRQIDPTVGEQLIKMSEEMKSDLEKLGTEAAGIVTTTIQEKLMSENWGLTITNPELVLENMKTQMEDVGKNSALGYAEGFYEQMKLENEPKGLLGKAWNWVITTANKMNEQKSPSRVFMEIGDYSAQGYAIGLFEGLRDTTRVWESVIEDTKETLDMHSPSKKFEEIGKGAGQGFVEGVKRSIGLTPLLGMVYNEESAQAVINQYEKLGLQIGKGISEMDRKIRQEVGALPKWTKDKVTDIMMGLVDKLGKFITDTFDQTDKETKNIFGKLPSWFENYVSGPIKGVFKDLIDMIPFQEIAKEAHRILGEIETSVKNTAYTFITSFTGLGKWFEREVSNPIEAALRNIIKLIVDMLAKLAALKVVEFITGIPTTIFNLKMNTNLKRMTADVPLQVAASGGMFDEGQMFIAREAGPELVGTIGNRTAVVNNEQIVESISRGVYEAVSAAMSKQNSSGKVDVKLYLDGKDITRSVEKVQQERGIDVMPGGAVYGW